MLGADFLEKKFPESFLEESFEILSNAGSISPQRAAALGA